MCDSSTIVSRELGFVVFEIAFSICVCWLDWGKFLVSYSHMSQKATYRCVLPHFCWPFVPIAFFFFFCAIHYILCLYIFMPLSGSSGAALSFWVGLVLEVDTSLDALFMVSLWRNYELWFCVLNAIHISFSKRREKKLKKKKEEKKGKERSQKVVNKVAGIGVTRRRLSNSSFEVFCGVCCSMFK